MLNPWISALSFALLLGGCAPASAELSHDATSRRSFANVEHWVRVFDDPERDAWQKPHELIEALEIQPASRVADLGAGTGYLLGHLSRAVGEDGVVLAIDTEPALVEHLRDRADKEGLSNATPILASADNPRIPAKSVDLILILDTYHHIDDRVAYARDLQAKLRPGGRVVIIDWRKRDLPVGPPRDHKLARSHVIAEMAEAGFTLESEPEILPHQYFLNFRPSDGDRKKR